MGSTSIPGFSGAPTLAQSSTDVNSPGFTGLSSYASDLQNALNRSIALASLPLRQLQNQQSLLTSQSSALSSLDTQFSGLQSAVTSLSAAAQNLQSISVSDQTVLNATLGTGALQGAYRIQVIDPGLASTALSSSAPVTDPATQNISSSSSFTLILNGVSQQPPITPAAHNLNSLAAAINAANEGVQATIVNVGQPGSPNYQISLQSTQLGNISIGLNDGSSNLMGTLITGKAAQYQVNGSATISSTTDTVTIAPGVTASLLQAGNSTITVSQNAFNISNALSTFATAYNSAVDELNKSRGQTAGPLGGDSVITGLTQALNQLVNYSGAGAGAGPFNTLTDLGLEFDTNGHLNFNAAAFANVSGSQLNNLVSFLGNSTSGGFLQFATNLMTGIEDSNSGLLKTAISSTAREITNENTLMANQQARLTQLQTSLQAQMSKADALISQIESQTTYFTTMFQSMLFPPNQVR